MSSLPVSVSLMIKNLSKSSIKSFQPLKEYFLKHRLSLAVGLASLLTVDLLQLLIPMVIKRGVDSLTTGVATPGVLFHYGTLIMLIAFVMAILRYVWRHLLFGLSRKIEEALRNKLYNHLQSLSLSFYQKTKTGDVMAKAINDINAIRMATGMGLVALTDGTVLGIAAIGFMLYINPHLTLLSLIPAPFLIYVTRVLTSRMSSGYEKVQATFSDLTERVRETFSGIRVIKAYAREPWTYRRVEEESNKYISDNMELARSLAFFFPVMAIFTNLGLAIVIWLGGRFTILGHITTGDFVAFISYLNLLTWPMMAIGWVTNLVQRGAASMRRINRIIDEIPEITGPPMTDVELSIKGSIEFRKASLRYPGQSNYAVKGISLDIAQGKTVALVGRVASGKTTLLRSVPRLIDPPRGTLFVDGRDVREIPLKILRQSIGFATQEAFIFSDTVRNNVIFGREGISEKTLVRSLKLAQIYEEAISLRDGLETLLGERGITLSGGQRQRLSIARAILSDPQILILDDALSMVDTNTEERILDGVLAERAGKTNIIVSHRLSITSRADEVVVLDRGEVVEVGNHATLIKAGSIYTRLYEKQALAQELEIGV